MSRRSRKRGQVRKSGRFGMVLVAAFIAVVVGIGATHAWVRHYLHGEAFRSFMSDKVSGVIDVDGRFAAFHWDGLAVGSKDFEGQGDGLIGHVKVEDLRAEVGLDSVLKGVWKIQGARARRVEVMLNPGQAGSFGGDSESGDLAAAEQGWLPRKVEVEGFDVDEVAIKAMIEQGELNLDGVRVKIRPAAGGQSQDVELSGGVIRLPWEQVPDLRLREASLRHQHGSVFLNHAEFSALENARLEAHGEWSQEDRSFVVQGHLGGVRCREVMGGDWVKRVSGDLATSYQVTSRDGDLEAKGRMVLNHGVLTALPVLDTLAAYADSRRFRVLNLSEARVDWQWRDGVWQLTDLVMESEGLLRLEGDLSLQGRNIDGLFQLGLAPGTLASIPGAESHVFKPGKRGYLWAPVRITGTLDDPQQDLKGRLIRAAGARMFTILPDTGVKVLKYSGRVIKDSSDKVLEGGAKVMESGGDVIKGAGGLLNKILGGGGE